MNIQEAKQEIIHTLQAYLRKDDAGNYLFPAVHQRPILLMGPPGIGKTAIMEQVARRCGVGLVAYTITHHTRQSAIGLPHIEEKTYGGQIMSVTEYTMSEIIASVYETMERTGCREGILFLDEINCVSETLAPTMLQFLQNKTFGTHRVPEGWVIVAAGNPPEYNKSVREFDVVTLDRVRQINVEADLDIWLDYAREKQLHGAVISYLSVKRERFYMVKRTEDNLSFITARGWEDLSQILKGYEALQVPVTEALVSQFLHHEETARDFAAYYRLYQTYGSDYAIPEILNGTLAEEAYQERVAMARGGSFDERITVVNLVLDALGAEFGPTPLVISNLATAEDTSALIGIVAKFCVSRENFHQKYEAAIMDMIQCAFLRSEKEVVDGYILSDGEIVERLQTLSHMKEIDYWQIVGSVWAASTMSRPILERYGQNVPLLARQILIPVLAVGLCYGIETDVVQMVAQYIIRLLTARGELDSVLRAAFCHHPENYISLMEYYTPEEHGMEPFTRE